MDCFEILGIEETKDERKIKRAYSKLLVEHSPEKDPEGFKNLRAAYEQAISKSKEDETNKKKLSPVDEFMDDFKKCYKNFNDRINIDPWARLLEREECFNIDSSKEVSARILEFLMDDYYLPCEIWQLFNSYFGWSAKKEDLYKKFPKNFIDFVMYKINSRRSSIKYEYLKDCKDNKQDEFISNFNKLCRAIDDSDFYTASNCIKIGNELCPNSPDFLVSVARYFAINGQVKEAFTLYEKIIEKDKNDVDAIYYRGELNLTVGNVNEAYNDFKQILMIEESSVSSLYSIGKCCIMLQKYDEAIKYLQKIESKMMYRDDFKMLIDSAYNFYIDSLKNNTKNGLSDIGCKFELAQSYFSVGKEQESYEILNELIKSKDATCEMYYLFSRVLFEMNNVQEAYNNISKATELFECDYKIYLLKGDILDNLGEFEQAIECYNKSIKLNDKSFVTYNNKAFTLNKLKRFDEAIQAANKSIEVEPKNAHSYKNKANALFGQGLYEDCIRAADKAISIYEYLTEAYEIKMKTLNKIKNYDETINTYNRARSLDLNSPELNYEKARALMLTKKLEEAIEYYDIAIELNKDEQKYYYNKGMCYYYLEKNDEAILWIDKAIEIDNNYEVAYYYKIRILIDIKRYDEALIEFDKVFKLSLQQPDVFYELKGNMMFTRKDFKGAAEEYKKAIQYDSDYAQYYYDVGKCFNDLNNYNDGIRYLKKAIKLDSNVVEYYIDLGYALYKLKMFKECIEACNRAIEIDPKYITAYQNKGWSLFSLGRLPEAEKVCNDGLKVNGNHVSMLWLKIDIYKAKKLYNDALGICDRALEIEPDNEGIKTAKKEVLELLKASERKGIFRSLFK
jgi:tetratricopeptide (TPR) repeat protein